MPKPSATSVDTLYFEIVKKLEQLANPDIAKRESVYFKKEGYKTYGIKTPEIRRLIRSYKKEFMSLPHADVLTLASKFIASHFGSQDTFAIALLQMRIQDFTPVDFGYLDTLLDDFKSWGTTDDFCINVLQPLLRTYPKETLALLHQWNKSDNLWKRRASVVAFVRKIGESGEFTAEVLDLCKNLIWDSEDLVQKGVGWALEVLEFVKDLRKKAVPATITLYAIRDLTGSDKDSVLAIK